MSSCWKCGKTLPDGQVECEYGCGDAPVDQVEVRILTVEVSLSVELIDADPQRFDRAVSQFKEAVELLIHNLDVLKFVKFK